MDQSSFAGMERLPAFTFHAANPRRNIIMALKNKTILFML
jgi:hypothetical protein